MRLKHDFNFFFIKFNFNMVRPQNSFPTISQSHNLSSLILPRKYRYEVMDGEDEDDEDAFEDGLDLGSRDELTPNFSSSQYSLNRTPLIQVRFHWTFY